MRRKMAVMIATLTLAACSGTDEGGQSSEPRQTCGAYLNCREEVCHWAAGPGGFYDSDARCFQAPNTSKIIEWCYTHEPGATREECVDRALECRDIC